MRGPIGMGKKGKTIEERTLQLEKAVSSLCDKISKLEKRDDLRKTDRYSNYYFEKDGTTPKTDVIKRLAENIDQGGTILEIKARKLLKRNKYGIEEFYYEDPVSGKVRGLDIRAHKSHTFKIGNTKVSLHITILAECKYRSQLDVLFFDTGDRLSDLLKFPVFPSADYSFTFDGCLKRGMGLITSGKVTQLQLHAYAKKGSHLNSDEIFKASSQVYDALRVHYDQLTQLFKEMGDRERDRSNYAHELFMREKNAVDGVDNRGHVILKDFPKLRSVNDLLMGIENLSFDAIVPAVIYDENRGVLKAVLDKNSKLVGIEDMKLGLYRFAKGYMLDEGDFHGDYIALCNLEGLEILVGYLEGYMTYYEKRFRKLFAAYPMTLFHLLKP
jgi:hypothetical protein